MAGAKKREEIYEAFESIYPVLQQFRKGEAAPTSSAQALPSTAPARSLPVRNLTAPILFSSFVHFLARPAMRLALCFGRHRPLCVCVCGLDVLTAEMVESVVPTSCSRT